MPFIMRLALVALAACAATALPQAQEATADARGVETLPRGIERDFGPPPTSPEGPLEPTLAAAIEAAFVHGLHEDYWGPEQDAALEAIAASDDVRTGWILSDLMRMVSDPRVTPSFPPAATRLLGVEIPRVDAWGIATDHLIAWDVPAPPGYLEVKRSIYTLVAPEWERLFVPGDVDWRHVSWGGVLIDDRAYGTTDEPCRCIPAADDPETSPADEASWLADDDVVFGIEIHGEARAYPRRIMEVREMVNDTLGGRHLGIPYCTLCASAQAWFTDAVPDGVDRPILRTSGLLIRSNKVMYDLRTFSVFDTFRGQAVTGPLADRGVTLEQAGVVTTTWGAWRAAHPHTTVLVEALALGRDFDFRNGPIFPIGDADLRLPVQEDVLGVVTASGTAVAFHVASALDALRRGETITVENVHLVLDGGGLRAVDGDGVDLGGHQAFWFAWSQFHPGTLLWPQARAGGER